MPPSEESIRDAIAREEAKISRLGGELEDARAVLEFLRAELSARRPSSPTPLPLIPATPVPGTSAERVARFRDRDDIYPRLWTNARTGRNGYAPACANECVRGICEKPRVKCGECPHQAFLPVENQVILDHLRGRHIVGVYPLLTDETCWFLAADFDKTSWAEDVAAFVETCRRADLPAGRLFRTVIARPRGSPAS